MKILHKVFCRLGLYKRVWGCYHKGETETQRIPIVVWEDRALHGFSIGRCKYCFDCTNPSPVYRWPRDIRITNYTQGKVRRYILHPDNTTEEIEV